MAKLSIRERLESGEVVEYRPTGNSMRPRILSGQKVRVRPITPADVLLPQMVVFVFVNGECVLHLISKVDGELGGERFLITNNKGQQDGWVKRDQIFGIFEGVIE